MLYYILPCLLLFFCSCCKPVEQFDGTYAPTVRFIPAAQPKELIDLQKCFTLAELIDMALQHNPETKQQWYVAKAAAARVGSAKSSWYPNIALQADGIHTRTFEFIGGPVITDNQAHAAATLSYLLLDFGQRSASIEEAKESLRIANWNRDWTMQQVIMQLLGRYYEHIETRGLLAVQEMTEQEAKIRVEAAHDLWQAGLIAKSDFLAAQSDWIQSQMQLSHRKTAAAIAMASLASSAGLEADTVLEVENVPNHCDRSQICAELHLLIEKAKTKRLDLQALRAEMTKKNLEIKRTHANLWPKMDALAKSGWAYDQKSPSLNIYNYAFGLSLQAPLFEGFRKTYECKRARADAQATLAELAAKEREVALDVLSHFETLKSAEERTALSKQSLAYAEEAYNGALEQYRAGCFSIFSLIECSKVLTIARESALQANVRWFAALAGLAYTTGGLLEEL